MVPYHWSRSRSVVRVLTEASGGDVRGHEDASRGHAELVEDIVPVLLVLVSVDGKRSPASAVDGFCYFIDLDTSYRERFVTNLFK